jgi:hypothetical protein
MELVNEAVTVSIDLGLVTDLSLTSLYDLSLLEYGAPTTVTSFTVENLLTAGTISTTGNITVSNITVNGIFNASTLTSNGNITGGNLISNNLITASGNVVGGNIVTTGIVSATGNISGSFILGNGSQLTGIITTVSNISNGSSNINAVTANGNITVSVAGNSNVAVFGSGQVDIKANIVPATANVFSLGNASHRWTNLWVSGNTITLGNIVLNDENANDLGIYTSNGTTSANIKAQIINTAAFAYNSPNITASGNISSIYNAMGSGPITIGTGVTVTVNSGAIWTIV